jgi:NADPH:quinone reductase-like Zn-dependent oxidoreductase
MIGKTFFGIVCWILLLKIALSIKMADDGNTCIGIVRPAATSHCNKKFLANMSSKRWEAKQVGGPENLELVDFELKEPSAKEVSIKVLATTATYTDLLILAGNYRPKFPLPVTPGYDLVGIVKAVGSAVTTLKTGDFVISMPQHGCMSTDVLLPEGLCVKIESCFNAEKVVSMVLTGVTAHQMLHRVAGERISSSSSILVHGAAGGTGSMIVQLAKLAGVLPSNIYGESCQPPFD